MTSLRTILVSIFGMALLTSLLSAQDLSTYREFQLGAALPAVAKQARMKAAEAKTLHQRPALIQELEWQALYLNPTQQADSVRNILFSFYNGELFQIVTTYDHQKVEGMTEADMVEAISLTYGAATKPAAEIAYHSNYGEVAPVISRWENSEYSYNLIRTGDQASFALILSLKYLDALAQAAIVEAGRLDALEAPQRAIDLQKKQDVESRLVLDKARSVNMPNFRP